MKVLIVSDTHRKDGNPEQVIARTGHLDTLIHLGDAEGSEHIIVFWVSENCDLQTILDNNDFLSSLEREEDIMTGGYRVLLTHEHYYNVSVGAEYFAEEARARGSDMAMFGHTHRPFYEVDRKPGDKDLIVLNPGSLSYLRQDGHKPSYMLMGIGKEGGAHFFLSFLQIRAEEETKYLLVFSQAQHIITFAS